MKTNLISLLSVLFLSLFIVFSADAETNENASKNKTTTQQPDSPLRIINRPQPTFPRECFQGKRNSKLKLRLKATFHSSGEITDTEITQSSGCGAFDKEALRVAKKIKFKPAIKNGEPITVTKAVEYAASIR